jgi:5-(carboxyamino)imidazole ribonucleotide synthase
MAEKRRSIGILGGGQLGMYSAEAAKQLGFETHIFDQSKNCPASQIADKLWCGDFQDEALLKKFANACDVITLEFENIPLPTLQWLEKHSGKLIAPSSNILKSTQNRILEKSWLSAHEIPVTPFVPIESLSQLEAGIKQLGTPCVLKTAGSGYDGKGQAKIEAKSDLSKIWQHLFPNTSQNPEEISEAILEAWVPYKLEFSVIVARNHQGECVSFPPIVNHHANHILDISVIPGILSESLETQTRLTHQAESMAQRIAHALKLVGLLTIEFFLTKDGQILVNELAPRPHNSGHLSREGFNVSQYEQHIRAISGLDLIQPEAKYPAIAMANLLGEWWQNHPEGWQPRLPDEATQKAALNLYGKAQAKPGRKMGHLVVWQNHASSPMVLDVLDEVKALRLRCCAVI